MANIQILVQGETLAQRCDVDRVPSEGEFIHLPDQALYLEVVSVVLIAVQENSPLPHAEVQCVKVEPMAPSKKSRREYELR